MSFSETQLPGQPGVFDGTQWRGAGTTGVATDDNAVGIGFCDTGGNRADSDLADQLHRDFRIRIRVVEIVDELSEVFDRVDVVVGWRRDQIDPWCGMPNTRNVAINFVAR